MDCEKIMSNIFGHDQISWALRRSFLNSVQSEPHI